MIRKTPHLAYLCSDPGIPPDGSKGASVHFREMARALEDAGASLDVFMARRGSLDGRPVHVVKPSGEDREQAMVEANEAMLAAMQDSGPHDAVYERFSSFAIAGSRYARANGIPHVLEVNAPLWIEDARYRELQRRDSARDMALEALRSATRVIAVSEELRRILVAEGVPAERITVMHNCVNGRLFDSAVPHEIPAALRGKTVLTFMGSLKPWHGIEFLLGAFLRCAAERPIGLWVVGDGTLRETVMDAAARHPEAVYWQGAVDHAAIPGILKAADIAVAPYGADAPSYFCPLKAIEALAAGCPLLASDVPCVTDVVGGRDGVRLFRRGDEVSFATALDDLIDSPPARERDPRVPFELTWASNARRVLGFVTLLLFAPLLLLAGCQRPNVVLERSLADLERGMWIEAEGTQRGSENRAENVTELDRTSSSTVEKLEVTARVESVGKDKITVLGREVEIVDKTDYEDENRKSVSRFPIQPGDWLRLKLRVKDGNQLRARTIRKSAPRNQFQVEGEITRHSLEERSLDVGSIRVQVPQDTRIRLRGEGPGRALDDPLSVFLEDDQKSVPFSIRLSDTLLLGGQATLEFGIDDEFDLDPARQRNRQDLTVSGKVDLLWLLGDKGSFALLEGSYRRRDRFLENQPDETSETGSLSRAYAYYRYSPELRFQVGRQDFDDEREWLYDEVLDGFRVYGKFGEIDVEVSASAGREFAEDEGNDTEDTAMYAGLVRYQIDSDHRVTAYAIRRTDSSPDDFEPLLFGVRSYSKPSKGLGHWLEFARAGGHTSTAVDGTPLATRSDISGTAFDVGGMYRFDAHLRPTVYAGYAYGRGKMPGSGEEGFRQTGLQDNNAKFGGVTSFRYYGEIFEPELSNIDISTFGVGIRPMSNMSVDVVAHGYRQDYKTTVRNSDNLRANPNGVGSNLGWEVDVVVGYRHSDFMRIEVVFARFDPGSAFDENEPAHMFEIQGRFKF